MQISTRGQEEALEHYLYSLLAYSPNDDMTAFTFWSTIVGCSALTGNAYAQITRDPDGTPNGLWPLHPLKTQPVRQQDGSLAFRTSDGMRDGTYRIIASKDILHFPLFGLDGIKGISPVSAARESFALAKAAEKYGARWFGNGAAVPSVLINKDGKPNPKVQQELTESWQSKHGGANAHKQAFLFGDWDVKTIGLSPEDSQISTRGHSRDVPPPPASGGRYITALERKPYAGSTQFRNGYPAPDHHSYRAGDKAKTAGKKPQSVRHV
jgi:HK97 family phage portal protein